MIRYFFLSSVREKWNLCAAAVDLTEAVLLTRLVCVGGAIKGNFRMIVGVSIYILRVGVAVNGRRSRR